MSDAKSPPVVLAGPHAGYRERLLPPLWAWAVCIFFALSLGLAYGFYLGGLVGWVTFLAAFGFCAAWFLLTAPTLRVDDAGFAAGRACLPFAAIGRVFALDAEQTRNARGRGADPGAWLVLRTWCGSRSVIIEVADPADPHPYWLVSSRHPEQLTAALADRQAAHTDQQED